MMKKLIFALLPVLMQAGVPSNSVTITAQAGAQPGRPLTINRWFAKGEISGYAKPVVRGAGTPAVWQNDVKIRWRDGRATRTISGATNTTPIKITAAAHAFQDGERVTISGVAGNTAANGTWTIQKVSAGTFELLNSVGNGTYTSGGSADGPAAGSLRHALISFKTDLPANPSLIVVDFTDSATPCSAGDQAACDAAALNAAGMLAFNGGTWTGVTGTSASGVSHSASARTMLSNGHFTYWLRGPAVTQVIAEDPAGSYDWGYSWTGSAWVDDGANKGLHPLFVLTFYTGWPGVKIEYGMQNVWALYQRDQTYDVSFTNSSGVADSMTNTTQWANTMFRRVLWDGTEPGGAGQEKLSVKVDLNLAYMIYAKTVPPLMTSYTIPSATATSLMGIYNANTDPVHGPMYCYGYSSGACGNIPVNTGNTGGAANIGLIPAWDSLYLRTMDPQHRKMSEGNADHNGSSTWYYWRENNKPSGYFDHAQTTAANGRWVSIVARPSVQFINNYAPDNLEVRIGTVSSARPQQDNGHHAASGMGYILSGEWWHLQVALGQGSFAAAGQFAGMRRYSMGLYHPRLQPRYYMWPLRDIGYAALIAPDGTPEQAYFQYIVHVNVAYWEGAFNVTKSRFYSEPRSSPFNPNSEAQSSWSLGRWGVISMGQPNPLGIVRDFRGTAGIDPTDFDVSVVHDQTETTSFMNLFIPVVFGWLAHTGLADSSLPEALAGYTVGRVLEPTGAWNPYWTVCYNCPGVPFDKQEPVTTADITDTATTIPVDMVPVEWIAPMLVQMGASGAPVCGNGSEYIRICAIDRGAKTITVCAGGRNFATGWCAGANSYSTGTRVRSVRAFQSWDEAARGFNSTYKAGYTGWTNFTTNKWADEDGYAVYVLGGLSWSAPYTFQGLSGWSAWDWINTKWRDAAVDSGTGKFLYTPYLDPVKVRTMTGDTFLILEYTKPRADQACTVDGVSDGVTNSRWVRFVKTGLAPSTSGSIAIHCDSDRYGDTAVPYTTTAVLSGMGVYKWTAAGTNTRINYGVTAALGASTGLQDCAVQCSAALSKGLQYVQLERADGAKGAIMPVLIN